MDIEMRAPDILNEGGTSRVSLRPGVEVTLTGSAGVFDEQAQKTTYVNKYELVDEGEVPSLQKFRGTSSSSHRRIQLVSSVGMVLLCSGRPAVPRYRHVSPGATLCGLLPKLRPHGFDAAGSIDYNRAILHFDRQLLPGLQIQRAPDSDGHGDLSFRRERCIHGSHVRSLRKVRRLG